MFSDTLVPVRATAGESKGRAAGDTDAFAPTVIVSPLVLLRMLLGLRALAAVLQTTDVPVIVHASAVSGAIEKAPSTTPVRVNKGVPPTTFIRRDRLASMECSKSNDKNCIGLPGECADRCDCGTAALRNSVPLQSVNLQQ